MGCGPLQPTSSHFVLHVFALWVMYNIKIFFFASRVINFKLFLIFFNIFDGKIKLLCFLKGKGGNKIIFITLYITIIYKLLFKHIRIFRVY